MGPASPQQAFKPAFEVQSSTVITIAGGHLPNYQGVKSWLLLSIALAFLNLSFFPLWCNNSASSSPSSLALGSDLPTFLLMASGFTVSEI